MYSKQTVIGVILLSFLVTTIMANDAFEFKLQSQQRVSLTSDQFSIVTRNENWRPKETAIIVCDVWDYHHSHNAVRRLEEFLPRLNSVLIEARRLGATIIHSPSDCMAAYDGHPARSRAIESPVAEHLPHDIASWCSMIPAEQQAVYPIDQSDGGDDDDPDSHVQWAAHLKAMGRE